MNQNKPGYNCMCDQALAEAVGQRLEQMRLEANIPQKQIAQELGISEGTYRSAIKGKMKVEVLMGVLRQLGQLDRLEILIREKHLTASSSYQNSRVKSANGLEFNTQRLLLQLN